MANGGGGWNSFMQSREAQLVLYSICVFFCLYYAVDGIMEMMSPERSALMIANIGQGGYMALTITRTVVLAITAVAFGRIVYKIYKHGKKDDE